MIQGIRSLSTIPQYRYNHGFTVNCKDYYRNEIAVKRPLINLIMNLLSASTAMHYESESQLQLLHFALCYCFQQKLTLGVGFFISIR